MSKDDLPPKDTFRNSAGQASLTRMKPFTLNQLAGLQLLWGQLINNWEIGCTMTFDAGHNHMRATYRLTNPHSEDKDITVALIEQRQHDGTYSYTMECKVDGRLHHQQDLMAKIGTRDEIPAFAIQNICERIITMNDYDFSKPMPLKINPSVTSIADWKARPK